jgi:hypothetical protein
MTSAVWIIVLLKSPPVPWPEKVQRADCLAFDPSGKVLFAVAPGEFSPLRKRGPLFDLALLSHGTFQTYAASATDGTFAAMSDGNQRIRVGRADGMISTPFLPPLADVDRNFPVFSQRGHRLACGYDRGHGSPDERSANVIVWDCERRVEVGRIAIPNPPGGSVHCQIAFNTDGTRIVAATDPAPSFQGDGVELSVWDVASGKRLALAHRKRGFEHARPFALNESTALFSIPGTDRSIAWHWRQNRDTHLPHDGELFGVEPLGRWYLASVERDYRGRLAIVERATLSVRSTHDALGVFACTVHPNGMSYALASQNRILHEPAYSQTATTPATNHWDALRSDPRSAGQSIGYCLAHPSFTLALLREHLRPMQRSTKSNEWRVSRIAELDATQFAVRDAAKKALLDDLPASEPALRRALLQTPSAEQKARIEQMLARLGQLTPEELRAVRCVEILERLDHPDAKPFLRWLATGEPTAALTKAARGE